MSAARLLRRITGRSADKTANTEEPILTHPHRNRARPMPRTIEHWCLIISLSLMALMAFWLAGAGTSVARASARLAETTFRAPMLDDYLARLPGKPASTVADGVPLTATELAAVNVLAAIERAFESIRQFENGRAEFRLGKLKSVVSSVAAGSPAQQAGMQKADEVLTVSGKPAAFVWELFTVVAANGAPNADIEFKRGETTYRTSVMLASGAPLELGNIGLQFEMPEGVRYLGPGDTRRLTEDFIRGYVEAIPPDWRKAYSASLDGVMRSLSKRAEDQKARSAQDPAYLRSEVLLTWHHEAFVAEIERMRSQSLDATQALAASLASLGRAAAGLACALILALVSLAFHSRTSGRSRSRRPSA